MWAEQAPDGRWRGRYRQDGRKLRVPGLYATENEARAAAEAAAGGRALPIFDGQHDATPTLASYARDWLDRQAHLGAGARRDYRYNIAGLAEHKIGVTRLAAIRPADCQRWYAELSHLAATTANQRLITLRSVLRDAVEAGLIDKDPSRSVERRRAANSDVWTLTREESDHLIDVARRHSPDVADMIIIGLETGMRWEEVAGLSVASVIGPELVRVYQVVDRVQKRVRPTTKSHVDRKIPTPEATARILKVRAAAARLRDGRHGMLFTRTDRMRTRTGETWVSADAFMQSFRPIKAEAFGADAGRFTFHNLRHTYATLLSAHGMTAPQIQRLLGHASITTTMRYIHPVDDHDLVLSTMAKINARRAV